MIKKMRAKSRKKCGHTEALPSSGSPDKARLTEGGNPVHTAIVYCERFGDNGEQNVPHIVSRLEQMVRRHMYSKCVFILTSCVQQCCDIDCSAAN